MMLAVSDTNGVLLGLSRMDDATVFSIDVAVAKSRNVIYFSNPNIDPIDTADCPRRTTRSCADRPRSRPAPRSRTARSASRAQPSSRPGSTDAARPYRRTLRRGLGANPCTNGTRARPTADRTASCSSRAACRSTRTASWSAASESAATASSRTTSSPSAARPEGSRTTCRRIPTSAPIRSSCAASGLPYLKFNRAPGSTAYSGPAARLAGGRQAALIMADDKKNGGRIAGDRDPATAAWHPAEAARTGAAGGAERRRGAHRRSARRLAPPSPETAGRGALGAEARCRRGGDRTVIGGAHQPSMPKAPLLRRRDPPRRRLLQFRRLRPRRLRRPEAGPESDGLSAPSS